MDSIRRLSGYSLLPFRRLSNLKQIATLSRRKTLRITTFSFVYNAGFYDAYDYSTTNLFYHLFTKVLLLQPLYIHDERYKRKPRMAL